MLSHRNIIANVVQLRQGWPDYWEPRPMSLSFLVSSVRRTLLAASLSPLRRRIITRVRPNVDFPDRG